MQNHEIPLEALSSWVNSPYRWGLATCRRAIIPLARITVLSAVGLLCLGSALHAQSNGFSVPNPLVLPDSTGQLATYTTNGFIDQTNPFFQSLGTNGRTCNSCHRPENAWTISPASLQARFNATAGRDPVFNAFDGTNCQTSDQSTLAARQQASSLLLSKGLIRIGMKLPLSAEYSLSVEKDPYGCALTADTAGNTIVSVYRRPLPSASVIFLSTVMWDGRENAPGRSINDDLISQARDATLGHAQASASPTDAQLQQIVSFQQGLFVAQSKDNLAGPLDGMKALGGAINLSAQNFFLGINDPLGGNPTGAAFTPQVFTLYQPWLNLNQGTSKYIQQRRLIAQGAEIFNNKAITISGVAGLNDLVDPTTGKPVLGPQFQGTCTTCHDSLNVGNHSVSAPLNIGITEGDTDKIAAPLDVADLPVFVLTCPTPDFQGQTVFHTTDPGRALVSGKCKDIGKTKGPILRGLAGRAPYFHNGSVASLMDAVTFYNNRFGIGLTDQEKAALVAFLNSL